MPMLIPPFDQDTPLFRGNLHGHTINSDGLKPAADVVSCYQKLGYDFIALSDHLWHDNAFAAERVTDGSPYDDSHFITIPSAELHCFGKRYDQDGLWHIVANGLPLNFDIAGKDEDISTLISRAIAAGAYISLAHPEWHSMTSDEAIMASTAHAVEVYNYSCAITSNRGSGIAVADILLQEGHRISFTATDDSHFKGLDYGGGWVMVGASELTTDSIVTALKAGRHYSSTGVEIHAIIIDDNALHISCSPAHHIIISGQGYAADAVHGNNLTYAVFDLADFASPFFRITVLNNDGSKAWSNPYWFDQLR